MRRWSLLPLIPVWFVLSTFGNAQLWSGIIDPSRAVNWANAGIPGGIPSGSWTQCGSTIAAYSGSAAAINNAIAACRPGQFVNLGAGTFNLSSGIDFTHHSNVVVRGQGANSTFLVFTGAGAGGYNSLVAMEGSVSGPGFENNVCDWTAGYSAGTNVITLANCGTTKPTAGSLSNLVVGTVLVLDQLDESSDTGQVWNCASNTGSSVCANTTPSGFERQDGTCSGGMCTRSQQQSVVVTAIKGSSVTISPGLYMPNWRSGQLSQAWFATTTVTNDGLENLSIDNTSVGASSGQNVMIANCYECWVTGVRSIDANRSHIRQLITSHDMVTNNYTYKNVSSLTVSYGIEIAVAGDGAVLNNITQQDTDSEPSCSGSCTGNVIGYNFDINNVYADPGWMQAGFYQHSAGDTFNLWEGNVGPGYTADDVHGTHHFETVYRNFLIGNNQSPCFKSLCAAQTVPVQLYAGSRYINVIGNVLGQSGFHNNYQCNATSATPCPSGRHPGGTGTDTSIYYMGYTGNGAQQDTSITGFCSNPSCSARGTFDPQVGAYLMRWGNYDVVTGAVRWCGSASDTGWSTTCSSTSEVPTNISSYSNSVPTKGDAGIGQSVMPASFYYNSQPSWWPSGKAWPLIGPDVTGGNIAGTGGFANTNPAEDCYLNAMNGPSDGSGGALSFNAAACYTNSSPVPPPTGLTAVVH